MKSFLSNTVSIDFCRVGGVELTRAESVIFATLHENYGEFVSQNALSIILETFGKANRKSLRTLVSRLRERISHVGYKIESGWKKGYKLVRDDNWGEENAKTYSEK